VSPAREGAFNANFDPATLEAFKKHCRDNGRQYTKVLEKLAEIYLKTDGSVLSVPDPAGQSKSIASGSTIGDLQNLIQKVQQMDEEYQNSYSHLEALIEDLASRVEILEK